MRIKEKRAMYLRLQKECQELYDNHITKKIKVLEKIGKYGLSSNAEEQSAVKIICKYITVLEKLKILDKQLLEEEFE